jgi:hypothetical protein
MTEMRTVGRLKLNLICKAGHRHWARNPNYWVGKTCDIQNCRELLRKMTKLDK